MGAPIRAAVLAALQELLAQLGEPVQIRISSVRSHKTLARFRLDPPPPPAQPREDDERDLHADILAVLRAAGRRLTADQIMSDLAARGWIHGERTVTGHLAAMVKAGTLDNDPRAKPPGYRIVER